MLSNTKLRSIRSNTSGSDDSSKILIIVVVVLVALFVGSAIMAGILYMNLPSGDGDQMFADASLLYDEDESQPRKGIANMTLKLYQPDRVKEKDVDVSVEDQDGDEVTSQMNIEWISVNSDSEHLTTGDKLIITSSKDISDHEVVLTFKGDSIGVTTCDIG